MAISKSIIFKQRLWSTRRLSGLMSLCAMKVCEAVDEAPAELSDLVGKFIRRRVEEIRDRGQFG